MQQMGSYCFGGAVGVRLGSTDLFDTLVIAHPGNITLDQIKAIKVPVSWVCAEDDMSFKKLLRNEAEAAFAACKDKPEFVPYEFKDYKGTVHGFAARPNLGLPDIVEAYILTRLLNGSKRRYKPSALFLSATRDIPHVIPPTDTKLDIFGIHFFPMLREGLPVV